MRRVLHAEWTKLRTVPSTAWLVLAIAASVVALGALLAASVSTAHCPTPAGCGQDTIKLSLGGVWLGQGAVAALAVVAITNEYANRLIHTTLAAHPRRLAVFAAKAAVVTAAVLAGATAGVLGALAAGRVILAGNGFTAANGYRPLSLADEPTLRAAAGTVLYLALVALIGVGLGTLIRDTGTAVTAALSLLYVLPVLVQLVSDPRWQARLQRYSPTSAGMAVQATRDLDQQPIGPWAGLGVLALYAGATVLAAAIAFRVRDA